MLNWRCTKSASEVLQDKTVKPVLWHMTSFVVKEQYRNMKEILDKYSARNGLMPKKPINVPE